MVSVISRTPKRVLPNNGNNELSQETGHKKKIIHSFKIISDERLHFASETCKSYANSHCISIRCSNSFAVIYKDEDQWGFLYPQWYEFFSLFLILVLFISV